MIARSMTAIGCAAGLMALAGLAHAAPPQTTAELLAAAVRTSPQLQSRRDDATPLAGVAQTAIDRRFEHGKAEAAVGFLCGRPEDRTGQAARVIGDDPHGRFLGARLSLAIR